MKSAGTCNFYQKLVYNLVYSKDRGSSFKRRGYWSRLSVRFGYLLGGGGVYKELGSCVPDLGSGIGGGGGG